MADIEFLLTKNLSVVCLHAPTTRHMACNAHEDQHVVLVCELLRIQPPKYHEASAMMDFFCDDLELVPQTWKWKGFFRDVVSVTR